MFWHIMHQLQGSTVPGPWHMYASCMLQQHLYPTFSLPYCPLFYPLRDVFLQSAIFHTAQSDGLGAAQVYQLTLLSCGPISSMSAR